MRLLLPQILTAGKKAILHIVSDEPGAVALQYSGPITGPSQVTIPGARQYRYGGNPAGQYAARLLSTGQGQDRSPASWLIRLRPEDLAGACAYQMGSNRSGAYYGCPIVWCGQPDPGALTARVNWMVTSYWAHRGAGSLRASYIMWASPSPTENPSQYAPPGIEYGDAEQYAAACVLTVSAGVMTRYMLGPNGAMQTAATSCSLSGTMGGTEAICVQWPFEQFAKYSRAITAQEASDWLLSGAIPSDPQIAYLGGHEIDGPQRVYDSGPMGLHLGEADLSVYPGTGFGAPVCAHRYVETAPVQPVAVEIEVEGAGNIEISAARTRIGVPSSRPDSERFEFASASATAEAETLTIGPDVSCSVPSYPHTFDLLIASNTDGVVNLASDNANIEVDATATVSGGVVEIEALALADVTGAVITASRPSGASDTCTVTTVEDLPEDWIAVGPNQRTRIEGKRIVWPIRVRSSKDGAFAATADPATGLIISGPFELSGGACDITAQPTQAGTWTLTVTQDGRTDSVTLEALAPVAVPTVRQYNLSAEIDAFFDFINRKYGFRPRFTASSVQDVRAEHATDRTYSRYAQGTGQPGSVFAAVALSYQVMISYSSAVMAEQDLGVLREEADRYGWNAIGFSMTGQTMFEPIKMMPRLTLTLNFDIIPQGR